MRAVLAVSLSLAIAGCSHVHLEAPPASATREQREAAFEQLKPKGVRQYEILLQPRVNWSGELVLENGEEITEPIDLLPVVRPDSETATHIALYEKKNRPWVVLAPVGFGAIGLGAATFIATAALHNQLRDAGTVATSIAGAAFLVGGLAAVIVGLALSSGTEELRLAAFGTYGADLYRNLLTE